METGSHCISITVKGISPRLLGRVLESISDVFDIISVDVHVHRGRSSFCNSSLLPCDMASDRLPSLQGKGVPGERGDLH